jgi:hypothetical protein
VVRSNDPRDGTRGKKSNAVITRWAVAIIALVAVPMMSCQSKRARPASAAGAPCTLNSAVEGGFSGFSGSAASLKHLGRIVNRTAAFQLYIYGYVNPANQHGSHRLMVFDDDCRFIGAYTVSEPPIRIGGQRVFFRDTGVPGNVVEFDGPIPPAQIWIDGDVVRLAR